MNPGSRTESDSNSSVPAYHDDARSDILNTSTVHAANILLRREAMPVSERENYFRSVNFKGPEWIPCQVTISHAAWIFHREPLEKLVLQHKWLFPDYEEGSKNFDNYDSGFGRRAGDDYTDNWGCRWETEVDGLWGQCVGNSLENWDDLGGLPTPDIETQDDYTVRDWNAIKSTIMENRAAGRTTRGSVGRYLFSRLWYVRGFENLMIDFATDEPGLQKLIDIIVDYRLAEEHRYFEIGVDCMGFGDDFGTQRESFISPMSFRRWITPALKRLFGPSKERGIIVHVHSDGYIMELVDDIIEAGADIINPQDLCNGVDDLQREVKGRICINLDIDRQTVVPFGSPNDIRELIKEEVMKLGSPEGGLQMLCGIYPPTSLENIESLFKALEEFRFYWS